MRQRATRARARRHRKLEPRVAEAIRHFVRVLSSCGSAPDEIARAVLEASRGIPQKWTSKADDPAPGLETVARMVTLWFSDPRYLDDRGEPRPLPLRGACSLEQLARRAGSNLSLRSLVGHPLRGALRRVGKLYLPRDRIVVLRGRGLSHPDRLRGLFGLLKTLDHNRGRPRNAPVRFQVFSYNENFPVEAREAFELRAGESCRKLVYRIDSDMHRRERARKPGERTVTLGVGFYLFEETPHGQAPAPLGQIPRTRKRS